MATEPQEANRGTAIGPGQEDLAAQVRSLEAQLGRLHRLATLGTLAGSIAHEFNNILTPVMSYAQLALSSPEDKDLASKALQKAINGTDKAARIATSMLGFIQGDPDDERRETRIVDAINETFLCLARDPAKDAVQISIDVPESMWVAIRPVALQQVLLNLIINAIDAIGQKPGRIGIAAISSRGSTWNPSAPGTRSEMAEIHVSDSGRGIPEGIRARVFEPLVSFQSKDSSRKGTGLGLSICKRLIDDAAGRISVESTPGQGTTFVIRLPIAEPRKVSTSRAA